MAYSRGFGGAERDDRLVKQRYIRPAAALNDDDLLVRGGDLAATVIRADARRNHSIYGTYGVSVFAACVTTIDELAQRPPLVRFAQPTLVRVDALRAVGMRLQPTGCNPPDATQHTTTSSSTTSNPVSVRSVPASTASW